MKKQHYFQGLIVHKASVRTTLSLFFLFVASQVIIGQSSDADEDCPDKTFPTSWERKDLDGELPYRAVYVLSEDLDGDSLKDVVTGGFWYKNPGDLKDDWVKDTIGGVFRNVVLIHDIDGDGFMDLFGSQGAYTSNKLAWARNDGKGNFTIYTNIPDGSSTYVEPYVSGAALAKFNSSRNQIALVWNGGEDGSSNVQLLTLPNNPITDDWTIEDISSSSFGEAISAGFIDDDDNLDLFQAGNWIRNNGDGTWTTYSTGISLASQYDRNLLADLDGDGDQDGVVTQIGNQKELAWFDAPDDDKTKTWTKKTIKDKVGGALSLDIADMDKDGDPDVIIGEWKSPYRLIVYENDLCNSGTWIEQVLHPGFSDQDHHDGAQTVDLDNDGDLDVVSVGWINRTPRIYINNSTPPNSAPTVDAGANREITLPANEIQLDPTVSDDGLPNGRLTYTWSVSSGDANNVVFSSISVVDPTVTFEEAGTYKLMLLVSDDSLSASDELEVVVNPVPNAPPSVNAGEDQEITLPSSASMNASISDDGLPNGQLSILWTVLEGKSGLVEFDSQITEDPTVSFEEAGTFQLQLTVDDGEFSRSDTVQIIVNPVPNQAPQVDAGEALDLTLPAKAQLDATVSDDGLPNGSLTYQWSVQMGDADQVVFDSDDIEDPEVSFLEAGIFVLKLLVDDGELSTSDSVRIVVNTIPNNPPMVEAGPNQEVTLPFGAQMSASASDDGIPSDTLIYSWTVLSGDQSLVSFNSNTIEDPFVNFQDSGTFVLQLTVSDGSLSATDEVTIQVNANPNIAPVLQMASDLEISVTDTLIPEVEVLDDGLPFGVLNYMWSVIEGEGSMVQFESTTLKEPQISFLDTGQYVLQLSVSDGERNTSGILAVTVNPSVISNQIDPERSNRLLSLFPNPVRDQLSYQVSGKSGEVLYVGVYNLQGQQVFGEVIRMSADTQTFSLNEPIALLPVGTYFVKANTSNFSYPAVSFIKR